MPSYRRQTYLFQVHFGAPKAFPLARRRTVLKAVQLALAGLPLSVLRSHLSRRQTYLLNLTVLTSRQIKVVNRRYRKKDKPTDVLSFSHLETPPLPGSPLSVGEILLCWQVIRRQAREHMVTESEELTRMTVHGMLHLFGYEHEQGGAQARRMFSLQETLINPRESLRSDRVPQPGKRGKWLR
jgi:probable rRNA maturation factor